MSQQTIKAKSYSPEPHTPSAEHKSLDVFVGRWDVEGQSYAEGQSNESLQVSSVKMKFVQTSEWQPGGFFLMNRWDGRVGDAEFNGMEVLGYDAENCSYVSRFFDSAGNAPTYQVTVNDDVWTYSGEAQRATFGFSDDGNTVTIHWDWKKNGGEKWLPLCDLTASKSK